MVVCVGSGGVGKTTISAALALGLAMRGREGGGRDDRPGQPSGEPRWGSTELGGEPHRIDPELLRAQKVRVKGELWAMMLDAKRTFDEIVTRLESDPERLRTILENPVYRELSTAVAGSHEMSAIAKLYELHEEHDFDTIVLDTPPSRNALDFLNAPMRLLGFLEGRALQVFLAPSGLTARLFGRGTGIVFGDLRAGDGHRHDGRALALLSVVDGRDGRLWLSRRAGWRSCCARREPRLRS